MLVLSRKKGERIVVTTPEGREIVVMVIELRGDKVRLGVQADKEVSIHRQEIQDAIRREREQAKNEDVVVD